MSVGAALALEDLRVDFPSAQGPVSAVDGVSLELRPGEILGLVGESGCGKSTLANAAMGLLPDTAEVSGAVRLGERELTALDERSLRKVRGDEIAMVFQDPSTSLDPVWTVGDQVAETIRAHRDVGRREAKERAVQLMKEVGIPSAEQRYADPPHRLSGGMKQRIVIAAALANDPAVLIADEPTTALDVTIQAQIRRLLDGLRQRRGTAVLLITHDLGVVAQVCDRVAVMYAGQLVEVATTEQVFARPAHPYTEALLRAVPGTGEAGSELAVIPGQVPDLAAPPAGCRFAPRCPFGTDACATRPALVGDDATGAVACWHPRTPDARRTEVTAS
jgi:oligopeptide/dipeptide ABC transporter ATP-binding protein